jgi:hypothetical protein
MLCVLMIHIVMDIFEITFSMFDYLLYVIIIMLIYGIKIIKKMPIFLTPSSPTVIMVSAVPSRTTSSIAFASRTGRGRPWLCTYIRSTRAPLFLIHQPARAASEIPTPIIQIHGPSPRRFLSFLFFSFCSACCLLSDARDTDGRWASNEHTPCRIVASAAQRSFGNSSSRSVFFQTVNLWTEEYIRGCCYVLTTQRIWCYVTS